EDINISGAKGVIVGISADSNLTMEEAIEASQRVHDEVGPDADIIWGMRIDENMGDNMSVTVIATGIGDDREMAAPVESAGNSLSYPGNVRTLTPSDLDMPTFIRLKKTLSTRTTDVQQHYNMATDEDDLEIPTFLRRRAD
ncbi:cell division protein FtsZ, partial [Desulfosarcina sp. OttesenSCG-928-G17]|nr:cell division protein FtsZ [Desulfosarcina sp. OttesenSCG-928-G17]